MTLGDARYCLAGRMRPVGHRLESPVLSAIVPGSALGVIHQSNTQLGMQLMTIQSILRFNSYKTIHMFNRSCGLIGECTQIGCQPLYSGCTVSLQRNSDSLWFFPYVR